MTIEEELRTEIDNLKNENKELKADIHNNNIFVRERESELKKWRKFYHELKQEIEYLKTKQNNAYEEGKKLPKFAKNMQQNAVILIGKEIEEKQKMLEMLE